MAAGEANPAGEMKTMRINQPVRATCKDFLKAPEERGCQCYVSTLSAHQQFVLRYGAHALTCPTYRESRDPVDRINDKIIRAEDNYETI